MFKQYRKKRTVDIRPYRDGEVMTGITISSVDKENGSPKSGDMIAVNPENPADMWLISAAYFADNYIEVEDDELDDLEVPEKEPIPDDIEFPEKSKIADDDEVAS
jgi:hypothetical protein